MDVITQTETKQESLDLRGFYSSISDGFGIFQSHPDVAQPVVKPNVMQLGRSERLEQAINDLQIGQRIQDELKRQGRTVTWLANQLGMERTSLYYTFRQSSIDLELLMRISCFLEHNFLQDVADVYKAYGL